ncbi:hypothetical protein N0V90_003722 [Kalmusia sp. IMI 367209]|nr:hypothetical protein N0V90_003722 [Kalmusia sp. IMI 367209]
MVRSILNKQNQARMSSSEPVCDQTSAFSRPCLQTSDKIITLTGSSGLPDGFAGLKLSGFPPQVKKRTTKTIHSSSKVKKTVNALKGELQLAEGFLPPSDAISSNMPKADYTPCNGVRSQLELVHASIEVEFDGPRQHTHGPLVYQVGSYVANQLARVTAPMREDEESDSSTSDEEKQAATNRWDFEDVNSSTTCNRSYQSELSSTPYMEEAMEKDMEEFGDVMFGTSNRRDEAGYWSQHQGLD